MEQRQNKRAIKARLKTQPIKSSKLSMRRCLSENVTSLHSNLLTNPTVQYRRSTTGDVKVVSPEVEDNDGNEQLLTSSMLYKETEKIEDPGDNLKEKINTSLSTSIYETYDKNAKIPLDHCARNINSPNKINQPLITNELLLSSPVEDSSIEVAMPNELNVKKELSANSITIEVNRNDSQEIINGFRSVMSDCSKRSNKDCIPETVDEFSVELHKYYDENIDNRKSENSNGEIDELERKSKIASIPQANSLLMCPLCLRQFEKKTVHISHMKSCAAKQNMSTRQLLGALDLLQKQSAERQAYGLPGMPVKRSPKKSTNTKRGISSKLDPNLELALALSMSMKEAEEKRVEQEEIVLIEAGLGHEVVKKQTTLLENFGFTSNKPIVPYSFKSKNRSGKPEHKRVPPLLTRSKEERMRMLTEKVAMILMEDEVSSVQPKEGITKHNLTVTSKVLRKICSKDSVLWNRAHNLPEEVNAASFYVTSLEKLIERCKMVPGSKLQHLSQIPGRLNSPEKECVDIGVTSINSTDNCLIVNSESAKLNKSGSEKLNSANLDIELETNVDESDIESQYSFDKRESLQLTLDRSQSSVTSDTTYTSKFVNDWKKLINNEIMSDIQLVVKDTTIKAHKLVFLARCPKLLNDISKLNKAVGEVDMIDWNSIHYKTAVAFLTYIYCGDVKKIMVLEDREIRTIRRLSHRYCVNDLLKYVTLCLKVRKDIKKQAKDSITSNSDDDHSVSSKLNSSLRSSPSLLLSPVKCFSSPLVKSNASNCRTSKKDDYVSEDNNSNVSISRKATPSPDIFSDNNTDINESKNESNEENTPSDSINSLDYLLNIVGKASCPSGREITSESKQTSFSDIGNCCVADYSVSSPICLSNEPFPKSAATIEDSKRKISEIYSPNSSDELQLESLSKKVCSEKNSPQNSSTPMNNNDEITVIDITQNSDDTDNDDDVFKSRLMKNTFPDLVTKNTELSSTTGNDKHVVDISNFKIISNDYNNSPPVDNNLQKSFTCTFPEDDLYGYDQWMDMDANYQSPIKSPINKQQTPDKHDLVPVGNSTPEVCRSKSKDNSQNTLLEHFSTKTKCIISLSPKALTSPRVKELPSPKINLSDSSIEHQLCSNLSSKPKVLENSINEPIVHNRTLCLLDDSYTDELGSCSFWKDEAANPLDKRCNSLKHLTGKKTPNTNLKKSADDVTPLPDYSTMKTPDLKKELDKYGLKHLRRNHAKLILRHIYDQLHPWVDADDCPQTSVNTEKRTTPFKIPDSEVRLVKSPVKRNILKCMESPGKSSSGQDEGNNSDGSISLSQSSYSSQESDCVSADALCCESVSSSQDLPPALDLSSVLKDFIKCNIEIYEQVLKGEPLWIDELHASMKANGVKCNLKQLITVCYQESISIRNKLSQTKSRTRKKDASQQAKKSKSPKKK